MSKTTVEVLNTGAPVPAEFLRVALNGGALADDDYLGKLFLHFLMRCFASFLTNFLNIFLLTGNLRVSRSFSALSRVIPGELRWL